MRPYLMLGTRNRKKRQEIVEILGDLGLEFGDLADRPDVPDVEETGGTFGGPRDRPGAYPHPRLCKTL